MQLLCLNVEVFVVLSTESYGEIITQNAHLAYVVVIILHFHSLLIGIQDISVMDESTRHVVELWPVTTDYTLLAATKSCTAIGVNQW